MGWQKHFFRLAAILIFAMLVGGVSQAQSFRVLPDFTSLVEQVGPSVVNIQTYTRSRSGNTLKSDGVGSGFIISADGYIMTNAHVVRGSDEVMVTLHDLHEYRAKVVGSDKRSDVAVVKIEARDDLQAVRIGDPSDLKVGEWVLAIGSPFGFENTVTAGIVSAKQRDTGEYINFIQSDVAINPGNSGGPLINMRGEVVGINSQIYSRSGGFMGISFSIPIDEAMSVAMPLRDKGMVERGRIGVDTTPVTSNVARAIGLGEKGYGAFVSNLFPNSQADLAGVQAGDIITQVNGQTVNRASDLPRMVGHLAPGSQAELQVYRRGEWKTLSVTIESVPFSSTTRSVQSAAELTSESAPRLRISVANLSAERKQELQLDQGVSVRSMNAVAARAGIRRGDVVLAVGNTQIRNSQQFDRIMRGLNTHADTPILVRRADEVLYVLVQAQPE